MADPNELGGLLWEREAELAYSKEAEIEKAAEWCRRNGPHKLHFLNSIRQVLMAEEIHMAKTGLGEAIRTGIVKPTSALILLSPSQALRLLECYKRATINTPEAWRAAGIQAIDKIEADQRRNKILADIRRQLRDVK